MMTLHIVRNKNTVTVPQKEFFKMIDHYRSIGSIDVIENNVLDYLTEEESKIRAEAMEELIRGETINFRDVKDKWLKGELACV